MLFSYPIAATADNWVHDCLLHAVSTIHQRVSEGAKIPTWPQIIPRSYRGAMKPRTGLRDCFAAYAAAIGKLSPNDRLRVLKCMFAQNEISSLVRIESSCDRVSDLPESVQEPIKSLFYFAFSLLTAFGVRDDQYEKIYNASRDHVLTIQVGAEKI